MPRHTPGMVRVGSLSVTNDTTDNSLEIDQNAHVGTAVARDGALHIENTGNPGIGLGVYTNIGTTAAAALMSVLADNSAYDQDVVTIENHSKMASSVALRVNGGNNSLGTLMEGTSSDVPVLKVRSATARRVGKNGAAMMVIEQGSRDATGDAVWLTHKGSGRAMGVAHDSGANAGPSVDIDRDASSEAKVWGLRIVVDNVGIGGVGAIDCSAMSAGETLLKVPSDTTSIPTGPSSGRIAIDDGSGTIKYIPYFT